MQKQDSVDRPRPDRTVLVTGVTGLLGRQIKAPYERENWTVKGTGYSRADGVDVLKVDITKEAEVEKVLKDVRLVSPSLPLPN